MISSYLQNDTTIYDFNAQNIVHIFEFLIYSFNFHLCPVKKMEIKRMEREEDWVLMNE